MGRHLTEAALSRNFIGGGNVTIGVVGDVTGSHNDIRVGQAVQSGLKLDEVRSFLEEAKALSPRLGAEHATQIAEIVRKAEIEILKPKPDDGMLRGMITGVKDIAMKAGVSASAQGLVAAARAIIGA